MACGDAHQSGCLVIGGGLVGTCIAYGLARLGEDVAILDEGDIAFRATRGNFGLVWVQAKGIGLPFYARWTRAAASLWPALAKELHDDTGIDVRLQQPGGFCFCWSDDELARRARSLDELRSALGGDYPFEVLDPGELRARLPGIGSEVAGATYTPMDGHVNPLKLFRALRAACVRRGVPTHAGARVEQLAPLGEGRGFEVVTGRQRYRAKKVVLAAGLGNRELGEAVGLHIPVRPFRGQILVTERLQPFLAHPTNKLRQTDEGSVQVGDSVEDVGFDDATSPDVLQFMAARAVRTFPLLRDVNLVRAWGALRVMTPDGFPIYQQSTRHPGAYVVTCHSGVTLASAHALSLAPWIRDGVLPAGLDAFSAGRFAKPQQASSMYVN